MKIVRWVVIGVISLLLGVSIYFTNRKIPLVIVPNDGDMGVVGTFTDHDSLGHSRVIDFNNDSDYISLEYELKSGTKYPFVGFFFLLPVESQKNIYLNSFDYVEIKASSALTSSFNMNLYYEIAQGARRLGIEQKLLQKNIKISTDKIFRVSLDDFSTPDWWYTQNHVEPSDFNDNDPRVLRNIQIGSDHFKLNKTDKIALFYLSFIPDNRPFLLLGLFVAVAVFVVLGLINIIWSRKRTVQVDNNIAPLPYKPLSLENYADEDINKISLFLQEQYHDPELSLGYVSRKLGLSEDRVSKLIHQKFKQSFKQVLNQIRIAEASRLLKETDRQASDIAFQVGYNNYSHFFKIFKKTTGLSPKEIRPK